MNRVEFTNQRSADILQIPARILVGEDDPDDALLLERAFQDCGVQSNITFAATSRQIIDFLQGAGEYADRDQFPLPTLLLLDHKLGASNGLEVLEWLVAHPLVRRRLVVIVLTGSDSSDLVEKAYALGANAYLVKPMDYHQLVALARVLSEFWLEHNVLPLASRNS
jgi:CheY-like chemotaxis protein